jgi:predicted dehydrogenase
MPGVRTTTSVGEVLEDQDVTAVVIATSAVTHYDLCKVALQAGKDVYVEKPFVLNVEHAFELIKLADDQNNILMVGHLLEYHPIVLRLKAMIADNELGDIHYIYSQRVNLGTVREDENALWNFAPHDISTTLFLLGQEPIDVSARGQSYLQKDIEDVVFMILNFPNGKMAHIHVSWLDPQKIRKFTIVGSRKMAVFDDLAGNEKLKIYDKGADLGADYDSYAEYLGLRFGDVTAPYIADREPLRLECEHFLECVRNRSQPVSDGHDGLRVVKVLDAAQKSLAKNGHPIAIT